MDQSSKMPRTVQWILALGLLPSALGCHSEGRNGTNTGLLSDEEVLPDWHGVAVDGELWRVGRSDGPEHEVLGMISDAVFLGPGLALADSHSNRIHWYDRNGRHRVSAARRGGGPAEFRRIHTLDILPDGTLAALDLAGKVEFFDGEGEHKETLQFPGSARDMCLIDSTVVVLGNSIDEPNSPFHRVDLPGNAWTSFGEIRIPDHLAGDDSNEGRKRVLQNNFRKGAIACVAGRIVFARTTDGTVSALDENGSVLWERRIPGYVGEVLEWVPGRGLGHSAPEGVSEGHMVWGITGLGETVAVQIARISTTYGGTLEEVPLFSVFLDIYSGKVLGKNDSLPQMLLAASEGRIAVANRTPVPQIVTYSITRQ